MIQNNTFTKEWIQKISNQYKHGKRKADPALIEKVTKALHLLENLTQTDLSFIFKGGTALLLLLDEMHRFSIDIDIIIENNKNEEDLFTILSQIVERSTIFNRFEENTRKGSNDVPKAHYKFFYTSALDETESYVLLDVLFEKSHYVDIIEKDINCKFIDYQEPLRLVNIPSIDCILGDKLTAYAPNTMGIPYGKDKELEIIKQLFDVANLFDKMENIKVVRDTFILMVQQELIYREMDGKCTYQDVLDDVFQTSRIIGERGRIEKPTFALLQTGVNRIKDYIFSKNYIVESAVNSASKAAYLSLLIKYDIFVVERFDETIDLRTLEIKNPEYKKFRTIMKFDPEAYFYWYKSIEILEKNVSEITANKNLEIHRIK
ncbi:nucleotidyl transferase AbiEii/AbiGii toxin family protein [Acetobacterium tundrae]|uniref:Nucleotidyl transferase AbiEii/AbiGii toxin family protein n=1 Tax=Acetobacterium tundrae TaxID=132932 RepID=A0ABR6WMW5_9FIRM|nr:nucleotidyl transferase AbiEii/AbiGii toxin family protein [Acetobacterium tundrae]MBC3797623.1 nucleotidyl transferase AbiEii/AbiGii toxin family protein [Acetobacterium tundrae]